MASNQEVGRNVKRFRQESGLTMVELGERAGLAKQTIAAIESGRGNPTIDTLERLAKALGVRVRALVTELGSEVLLVRGGAAGWQWDGPVGVRPLDQAFGSGYVTNSLLRIEASRGRAAYEPRGRGSLHHCYVLDGEVRIGPTRRPVQAATGDFVRFPADVAHIIEAVTPTATVFACTTWPQISRQDGRNWF